MERARACRSSPTAGEKGEGMTDNSIGKSAGGAMPPFLVELAKNAPQI